MSVPHDPRGRSILRDAYETWVRSRRLDALPPLVAETIDPCAPMDFASPWREGETVYTTDGAIIATIHRVHLTDRLFESVPTHTASRQPRIREYIGTLLLGSDDPLVLSPHGIDTRRPVCTECLGTPCCPRCAGTGFLPRSGRTRKLNRTCLGPSGEPIRRGPEFGIDEWYYARLSLAGATLYLPDKRGGPARFHAGPVIGFVMPYRRTMP